MYPVVLFGSIMELILNGFVLPILYLKKSKVHETMHIKKAAIHLCYHNNFINILLLCPYQFQ